MTGEIRAQRTCRRSTPTFLFADLVGYTASTEATGDAAAADLAREFRRTMCALSRDHGARQVKSMGDGVMIWIGDAGEAVSLAAQVLERVGTRSDLLPVRVGVHTGPAVRRGGDWYGSAVNVAARLVDQVQPNEALVSEALVSEATWAMARCEFTRPVDKPCELVLRGLDRRVAAWRERAGITERPRVVLADAGYWSNGHIDSLRERGITPIVAPDTTRDRPRKTRLGGPYDFMRRVIATEAGGALYSQRQWMVEPVFAQIKANRRIERFKRRGRAAARSEWRLIAATHNLLKLHRHSLAVATT